MALEKVLALDSSGVIEKTIVTGAGVDGVVTKQAITLTAGQTTVAVPGGYSAAGVIVFLNGVYLTPAEYTASASPNIVLAVGAPSTGSILDVLVLVSDGLASLGTAAYANLIASLSDNTAGRVLTAGAHNLGVGQFAKNKLINGNFAVNQRVVAGTVVLAAGVYGHDRWKAGASGCTYTFATSLGVTTITITAGSLQQVIEGGDLFSAVHTLSWAGTAQGKIGAGSYSASGITSSVTGGANLTIEFNTGTVSKVQLEVGSVATPFEHRPYGQELALCQRYYWKIADLGIGVASIAGDGFCLKFPVTMRATPTMANASCVVGVGSPGTPILLFQTADGTIIYNSAGNWTTGAGIRLTAEFSAEL